MCREYKNTSGDLISEFEFGEIPLVYIMDLWDKKKNKGSSSSGLLLQMQMQIQMQIQRQGPTVGEGEKKGVQYLGLGV